MPSNGAQRPGSVNDPPQTQRGDRELTAARSLLSYIKVYDHDLDADICQNMIASFESMAHLHQHNGRGHREGLEHSGWTELNVGRIADPSFTAFFKRKIDAALYRYNRDVQLTLAVPFAAKTADLTIKRYRPGGEDGFQVHFDSIYDYSNRFLVLLWYLNDVSEGGATRFPDLGVDVAARTGRLLVFPPYWMFQHAGLPPVSNAKYIISTYLLF